MRALDARLGDGVEVIYEAKLPDDWFGVWGGGPADA
jgi:hypothetical protein